MRKKKQPRMPVDLSKVDCDQYFGRRHHGPHHAGGLHRCDGPAHGRAARRQVHRRRLRGRDRLLEIGSPQNARDACDLVSRTLTGPDGTVTPFTVDAMRREALLHGLDDIGLTLKDDELIRAWQREDRQRHPWARPSPPGAHA